MRKLRVAAMLALWVLAVLLVQAAPVSADAAGAAQSNCGQDELVLGDNFTLRAGETLDGNLIVLGGNATVEEDAAVRCNVVVAGGNVEIAGAVEQDMTVFAGAVALDDTAVIQGRLSTVGGTVSRAEGAEVRGGESHGFGDGARFPVSAPGRFSFLQPVISFYTLVFDAFFFAIGLALLALVVVLFWPDQTLRVGAAITTAPVASGGLGLLTLIAAPVLAVLLAVTICLIPVSFVAMLIFAAAGIFGWIALGSLVGVRLAAALRAATLSPALAAALGTFLFTLVTRFVGQIPCVGWIVPTLLAGVGLGAVVLTRFGTRPYLGSLPISPVPNPPVA